MRRLDWDVRWHGDEVAKLVEKAGADGLREAGQQAISDANRLIPKRSGALMKSGRVDVVFPVAVVSYGLSGRDPQGRDTRHYAIPQHQRFDYTHPRGGVPKFLERQLVPGRKLLETIAERIRRVIGE